MKRRTLLGGSLAALLPGACAKSQSLSSQYDYTPFEASPSSSNDGQYRQYYSLTKPGNYFRGDTSTFDLNVIVVPNSTQAMEVLRKSGVPSVDGVYRGDWSENAVPLYNSVRDGVVPAFRGQTTATFHLNLVAEHLPRQMFYCKAVLGKRYMQVLGMAEVRPSSVPGHSQVTIPVGDEGCSELIVPRSCMERIIKNSAGQPTSVVPVVQLGSNVRALQLPRITDGRFASWPNTLISKPSGRPGISHAADRALARTPDGKVKYLGVLYPFLVDTGGVHA